MSVTIVEHTCTRFPCLTPDIHVHLGTYVVQRYRASGKWYDDVAVTVTAGVVEHSYANAADIAKLLKGEGIGITPGWYYVMAETPWGYPMMVIGSLFGSVIGETRNHEM